MCLAGLSFLSILSSKPLSSCCKSLTKLADQKQTQIDCHQIASAPEKLCSETSVIRTLKHALPGLVMSSSNVFGCYCLAVLGSLCPCSRFCRNANGALHGAVLHGHEISQRSWEATHGYWL